MNTLSDDRNGTLIFAERVQKNLAFIVNAASEGKDVHPVTQAISTLLGTVVFPWEHSAFDRIKRQKLPVLTKERGWPTWAMSGSRRVAEVGDLLYVLRNCVSHGRIEFDSDSRVPAEVKVTFVHVPKNKTEPDWRGSIQADHMIDFCQRFSANMKGLVE